MRRRNLKISCGKPDAIGFRGAEKQTGLVLKSTSYWDRGALARHVAQVILLLDDHLDWTRFFVFRAHAGEGARAPNAIELQ
jgi:hypothetical protein